MEGFPNIFVEAWACGIPVYSLYFDPGSTIEKEKIGINAKGNIDELARLLTVNSENDGLAERARAYVINNHALTENKIKEINILFESLCKK
jgi:glycosyltransferase involved in cell wall biosynthesis